jgi:hypothetical protein
MDCKDLKQLKAEIEKRVVKALETDVSSKVELIESQVIKEVVLGTYTPREYERRKGMYDDGGIESVGNMNSKVDVSNGEVKLSVVNDTPVADPTHTYRLDEAIVEGGDYFEYPIENRDPNKYTYLKGRDFITATQERINSSGEVEKTLKDSLTKQGLKIIGK